MESSSFAFFVAVVEAGSFANAARKLGMDKSNVSRRIRDIEREIGAEVLARTTRSMSLTEAGALLYEHGVAINAQVTEATRAVLSLRTAIRGPLHVHCGALMLRLPIRRMIWDFCRMYPEVSLSLTLRNDAPDFARDSVDVALRVANELSPAVVARTLCPIQWGMWASPTYLRARGTPKDPEELAQHTWLGVRNAPLLEVIRGDETWRVRPFNRMLLPNHSLVMDAVLEGLGIGLLPFNPTSREEALTDLRPVLRGFDVLPQRGTHLYAVTPQSRYMPSQVRCFIDHLVQQYRDAADTAMQRPGSPS